MEEPLYFPSDGFRLFGVVQIPDSDGGIPGQSRITHHASRLGLVFCAPFAEEQKQAYRVFVELARRLEREGIPSLRFDYRGTGDSEGAFTEFSLAGALRDIQAAAALLRERTGVERVGLIGLRLGASLALRSAECGVRNAECQTPDAAGAASHSEVTRHASRVTHPPSPPATPASSLAACPSPLATRPAALILWQPIVDGALFHRLNIRRMLVRQMMTHGKASGERDTGDAGTIDLDGFLARRSMCEEIKALRSAECGVGSAEFPPTLLVQFAPSPEPSAELKPLIEKLGPNARFLPFVLEPFWDRLGYVDCSAPIEATAAWLLELAAE